MRNRRTARRHVLQHDAADHCRSQWQRHQVVEPGRVCTTAPSASTHTGSKQDRFGQRRLVLASDVTAPTRPVAEPVCVQLRLDVVPRLRARQQHLCHQHRSTVFIHLRLAGVTARRASAACRSVGRRLRLPHRPRCHFVDGDRHCLVGDCVRVGVQRPLVHPLLFLPDTFATTALPRSG